MSVEKTKLDHEETAEDLHSLISFATDPRAIAEKLNAADGVHQNVEGYSFKTYKDEIDPLTGEKKKKKNDTIDLLIKLSAQEAALKKMGEGIERINGLIKDAREGLSNAAEKHEKGKDHLQISQNLLLALESKDRETIIDALAEATGRDQEEFEQLSNEELVHETIDTAQQHADMSGDLTAQAIAIIKANQPTLEQLKDELEKQQALHDQYAEEYPNAENPYADDLQHAQDNYDTILTETNDQLDALGKTNEQQQAIKQVLTDLRESGATQIIQDLEQQKDFQISSKIANGEVQLSDPFNQAAKGDFKRDHPFDMNKESPSPFATEQPITSSPSPFAGM